MLLVAPGGRIDKTRPLPKKCRVHKKVAYTRLPPPGLIPAVANQPAGDVSHKPGGRLPLLSARSAVTLATLQRLLPILLFDEQRRDGCEQFA